MLAAYALIVVEVTSILRDRIRPRLWGALHALSLVTMGAGSYHAYLTGSDVRNPITWAIAGLGCLLVFGLVAMRLQRQDPEDPQRGHLADNRAILEEMRLRLSELAVPEATPQPELQVVSLSKLPRRAPVSGAPTPEPPDEFAATVAEPLEVDTAPLPRRGESMGFASDPFTAVPLADSTPELGSRVQPSAADPFAAAPLDPFRHTTSAPGDPTLGTDDPTTRFRARPFTDREAWEDDGADLFRETTGNPFAATTPTVHDPNDFPDLPPLAPELLSGEAPPQPASQPATAPFSPVDPPLEVFTAPAPAAGPPPLPDAVDPLTGEPDQAAYTEWLKDWLAYAERYGDEAPGDPSRI
ncbi:MAG: hypothetical protein R2695_12980 [Acidimicrobiales bacterium]